MSGRVGYGKASQKGIAGAAVPWMWLLVCLYDCMAYVVSVENQDPNSAGSRVPPGCSTDIHGLGDE
ncbi:hypothetical protein ACLOJK_015035, partial [Asimina triloba]